MGEILQAARSSLRGRWEKVACSGLIAGGLALGFFPFCRAPGYELAEGLTLLAAPVSALLGGLAVVRIRSQNPPHPARAMAIALFGASGLTLACLAGPWALFAVASYATHRCDPAWGISFLFLLTVPSVLLAGASGAFCAASTERARSAAGRFFGLLFLSIAWTGWPIYSGPQVFAFNHLLGYLPGPIYDEALEVEPKLLAFRVETLLLFGLAALATYRRLLPRGDRRRYSWLSASLWAFGLATVGLEGWALRLRTRMDTATVAAHLGGWRETSHFTIAYPREKPKEEVDRLERDLEYRWDQIERFLHQAPTQKTHVFLYRSAAEKKALVGAGHTQFTKPWLLQIHLNDAPFPHPTAKHELVHAMASSWAPPPFHATSRLWIWPQMGIIEGLAVAADESIDEMTLHEWSAAMRRLKLAPDVRDLLKPSGFYASSGPRAYTVVGSFIRYLAEHKDRAGLKTLYRSGDFETAYGHPLSELATEWEGFVDRLPLPKSSLDRAWARFRAPGLFSRPCGRQVSTLLAQAGDLLSAKPRRALSIYQRCEAIDPDDPDAALGMAQALAKLDQKEEAATLLSKLADRVKAYPALESDALIALADLAIQRARTDQATAALSEVVAHGASPAAERTAQVKLLAMGSKVSGPILFWYFRPGNEPAKLLSLKEALDREPNNPVVSYLLGRRLVAEGLGRLAYHHLSLASKAELPEVLHRDSLLLKLKAAYLGGDCGTVRSDAALMPDLGPSFGAAVAEWVDRCDFETKGFHGPLVPDDPFR